MQKAIRFIHCLLHSVPLLSFTALWRGRWEINVTGAPQGKVIFLAQLICKHGHLRGKLMETTSKGMKVLPTSRVEEQDREITLYFTTHDGDTLYE